MPAFGTPISLKGPQGIAGLTPTTSAGPRTDSAAEGQVNFDLVNFKIQTYSNGAWTESRSFAGTQGISGEVGFFGYGNAAPDSTTYSGSANGFFLRSNGQVYFYSKANGWQDSGESLLGPPGPAGQRGSYRYVDYIVGMPGSPPANTSSLVPPPMAGDEWIDTTSAGGPFVSFFS